MISTPLPFRISRFACVAWCSNIFPFIAGASNTGAGVAKTNRDAAILAITTAKFAIALAVAGATRKDRPDRLIQYDQAANFALLPKAMYSRFLESVEKVREEQTFGQHLSSPHTPQLPIFLVHWLNGSFIASN